MKIKLKYIFLLLGLCLGTKNVIGQSESNARVIEKLQSHLNEVESERSKIHLLHSYTQLLLPSEAESAQDFAEEALRLSRDIEDEELNVLSLINAADVLTALDQQQEANRLLNQAMQEAKSNDYRIGLVQAIIAKARVLKDPALNTYKNYGSEAKKLSEEINYSRGLAEAHLLLGRHYTKRDPSAPAGLNNYQQALRLWQQLGDSLSKIKMVRAHQELARHFEVQEQSDLVLYHYFEILKIAEQLDNKSIISNTANAIGEVYLANENDHDKALNYFRKAFSPARKYDFIDNGKALEVSIKGSLKCLKFLAKDFKKRGNNTRAEAYNDMYVSYENDLNRLQSSGFDVDRFRNGEGEERIYGSSNPNLNEPNLISETSPEIEPLLDEKIDQDRQEVLERLGRQEDQSLAGPMNPSPEVNKKESVQSLSKDYRYWWAGASILLMALLSSLVLLRLQLNTKQLKEKNQVINEINEKANRQVIAYHKANDEIQKKEKELAESYRKLEDALLEKTSIGQILEDDLSLPLKDLIDHSGNKEVNPLFINQSARKVLNQITNIVGVQNFEQNTPQIIVNKQALYPLADNALNQFSEFLKAKNIQTKIQIDQKLQADFDQDLLENVFLCYIDNALRYAPANNGKLILDAWEMERNATPYVKVAFTDNGQVIPQEALSLVYSKFAPEEARPSGLGLAYAKLVIEAHKGKVGIESGPDQTTFSFLLPSMLQSADSNATQAAKSNYLFPEDERAILQALSKQFVAHKYYETSALIGLLDQVELDDNASSHLIAWKKALEEAIYSLDEQKIQRLIRLI